MNLNAHIQYFSGDITKSWGARKCILKDLLGYIKKPQENQKKILDKIRSGEGNKSELKKKLLSFILPVNFKGSRKYHNITNFTGLMVLDFDKFIDKEEAVSVKKNLHESVHCIATWLSSSGLGVRAVIEIPFCDSVEEYKAYFWGWAVNNYLGQIPEFDIAPQNAILPLFLSKDDNILVNYFTVPWIIKSKKTDHVRFKPKYVPAPNIGFDDFKENNNSDFKKEWVIKNFNTALNKITDQGHPTWVRSLTVLGGHIASGHISQNEAIFLAENKAKSHPYLSQKPEAYISSIKNCLEHGKKKPL